MRHLLRSVRPCVPSLFCLGVALSTACGTAPPPGAGASPGVPVAAERGSEAWSPDRLLRTEIVQRGGTDHTAMEIIRRLRPGWLRSRGQNSFTSSSSMYPVVYIDNIRHGGLGSLYRIPTAEILRIEFIGTADATTRWGTGHSSGVINIITGR